EPFGARGARQKARAGRWHRAHAEASDERSFSCASLRGSKAEGLELGQGDQELLEREPALLEARLEILEGAGVAAALFVPARKAVVLQREAGLRARALGQHLGELARAFEGFARRILNAF